MVNGDLPLRPDSICIWSVMSVEVPDIVTVLKNSELSVFDYCKRPERSGSKFRAVSVVQTY